MHDHTTVVERREGGFGAGAVIGILLVVLIAALALFFVFGGPGRFAGGSTTAPSSNTNINQPAPAQQPQGGPNINIPRQIDVNVNQPPAQQPAQPPAGGR